MNEKNEQNFFWIRIFDYSYLRDINSKGILLDEFYEKEKTRDEIKVLISSKYEGETKKNIRFSKPKKENGIYALIMESNSYFYHRFYDEINTLCFCCNKHIQGKAHFFPSKIIENGKDSTIDKQFANRLETVYFCSDNCKNKYLEDINPILSEGDFQEKEESWENNYGYIYCIYNRNENKYYIGQTRYLPFFRWQEHVKSKLKGDITDLEFRVITTVKKGNTFDCQKKLNEIETWWINKYKEEGYDIMNIVRPHLNEYDYKKKYDEMISKYKQTSFDF